MAGNLSIGGHALRIAVGITVLTILLLGGGRKCALKLRHYKDIAISNSSGALTDYQVLVSLSSSNFPTNARTDGADIIDYFSSMITREEAIETVMAYFSG